MDCGVPACRAMGASSADINMAAKEYDVEFTMT